MRKGLSVTEFSKRESWETDELLPDCELTHSLGKVYEDKKLSQGKYEERRV